MYKSRLGLKSDKVQTVQNGISNLSEERRRNTGENIQGFCSIEECVIPPELQPGNYVSRIVRDTCNFGILSRLVKFEVEN